MAIHSKQAQQQIEAIRENLFVIEYCLNFDKNNYTIWKNQKGGLGYPAFILLASIIDTIGSFFRKTKMKIPVESAKRRIDKASEHFFILNHEKLFDLKLMEATITDFYSTYRSKLTHNNSLPKNNFLINDRESTKIFELDIDDKIISINLYPLFELTEKAANHFMYWLENDTFSESHTLKSELKSKERLGTSTIFDQQSIKKTATPSGFSDQLEDLA